MKRAHLLTAALAALLVLPAGASAAPTEGAGHNGPTRKLEAAFKVAQFERAGSPEGCYPAPAEMASLIVERTAQQAAVIANTKLVKTPGIIYVVTKTTRCDNVTFALFAKGKLWVLDSTEGKLEVKGAKKPKVLPGAAGPLRGIRSVTETQPLSAPDAPERFTILCPKKSYPLGGGMLSNPAPQADGEGVYPHSYERLGAQRGWHINPTLVDPSPESTTPRAVTMQVICAKGLVPVSAPHKTIFLKSGQSGTATATCPKGQVLLSGGFQRTNFVRHGGDYITESRAVGSRSWRVSGTAFGLFGGELSAIAYCDRSKRPLLTQVQASTAVAAGALAKATTPACPKGRRLTLGGFSFNGSNQGFFADGFINKNNTWTASAFGYFGAIPKLSSYGYCIRPGS